MFHRAHRGPTAASVPALAALATFTTIAAPSARALILNGGLSANPGTSYVGLFNGGTAVAVGPREILTAAHVGGDRGDVFRLGGTSYRAVSTITSDTADLMRITLDRDLPGYYPVTDTGAKRGARLTIAGFGITSDYATKSAFFWSDEREETWGYNRLDSSRDGHLWFKFDKSGGRQEASLSPGDSGGAVFITGKNGQLILAGINRGIYARSNGRSTFGDISVAVDLASQGGFLAGLAVVPTPGAISVLTLAGVFAARRRR